MIQPEIKKGFTLIEMLVVVAIIGAISVFAMSSVISMVRVFGAVRGTEARIASARTVLERVVREARKAGDVVSVSASPPFLSFDTGVEFSLQSGAVAAREGGGAYAPLTSPDVRVDSLSFSKRAVSAAQIVTVSMSLDGRAYQTSAVLRKPK